MIRVIAAAALLASLSAAAAPKPELVRNGTFLLPLEPAWQTEYRDYDGKHEVTPLDSGGVRVYRDLCGWAKLSQFVPLKTTALTFTARAKLDAYATTAGYYATAALVLSWLGADSAVLGETRFQVTGGESPAATGARVIPAGLGRWQDLKLDVSKELKENLKLKPDDVKAVRITLESFGSGTQSC